MVAEKDNKEKKQPCILQILPELKSGGVERGTIEIARALVRNNYRAIVASSGGPMAAYLNNIKAIHIELPLASKNPITMFRNIKRIKKIIKEYDIDIVHARSRAPAWSAYFACKDIPCHFMTTFHGTHKFANNLKKKYNSIMAKGEKIIAVSNFIKKHITDNYLLDERNITVIQRGVDTEQFDMDKVTEQRMIEVAKKIGIEHDRFVILLPGRITRWKGHEFLLDALYKIRKNNKSSKFLCLFVGDHEKHPNYCNDLRNKIKEYNMERYVRIAGNVSDMPTLYSMVDLVVSASLEPEAFGRVAIEAQAMGRMLIATNHGGSCETVIDGETGWLVEPGNVDQLANAINKALNIQGRTRKSMASNAKKHVYENFSLEKMSKKTIDVYDSLLAEEKPSKEPEKKSKSKKIAQNEKENAK
ncbi:glycosyltransferase family 4 protein [Rickettsiales bacterium]|nr:glycosyltransferase family 4 protein [Rickettsiales bacterium]